MTLISSSNSGLVRRENLQFPHVGFLQSALDWKTTGSKLQTIELVKLIDNSTSFWRLSLTSSDTLGSFLFTIPYQLYKKIQFSEGFSTHFCLSRFSWSFPCHCHYWRKCYSFLSNSMEGRNIFLNIIILFLAIPDCRKLWWCVCIRCGDFVHAIVITREDFLAFFLMNVL